MAPKRRVVLPAAMAIAMIAAVAISAESAQAPNFVVIVVDMLRADHLGLYGYSNNMSPNLDRLSQDGAIFENGTAAAPWTLPSTISLLMGLVPSEHGFGDRKVDEKTRAITYPADTVTWLPRRLAERG